MKDIKHFLKDEKKYTKLYQVRVDPAILKRIKKTIEFYGISQVDLIDALFKTYLEKSEPKRFKKEKA